MISKSADDENELHSLTARCRSFAYIMRRAYHLGYRPVFMLRDDGSKLTLDALFASFPLLVSAPLALPSCTCA